MNEVKINNNGVTKPVQEESVKVGTSKEPDVRDVSHFQALLSERVEGDQKKDSKRNPKNTGTDLQESDDKALVFGLFLPEKEKGGLEKIGEEANQGDAKADENEVIVLEEEVTTSSEVIILDEDEATKATKKKVLAEKFSGMITKGEAEKVAVPEEKMEVIEEAPKIIIVKNSTPDTIKINKEVIIISTGKEKSEEEKGAEESAVDDGKEIVAVQTKNSGQNTAKAEAKGTVVAAEKAEILPVEKKKTAESEKGEAEIPVVAKEISVNIVSGEKVLTGLDQISDTKIVVSAEAISKVGNEVIERLVVVQSVNGAKQEVVMAFKDNVLPGTQLSLLREGSVLSLAFTTVNTQSLEFLTAGQDGLRNFLLEQLKDITAVHIKSEGRESGYLGEKNPQKRQQDQQSEKENDENMPHG
jgi:hypothetical protein